MSWTAITSGGAVPAEPQASPFEPTSPLEPAPAPASPFEPTSPGPSAASPFEPASPFGQRQPDDDAGSLFPQVSDRDDEKADQTSRGRDSRSGPSYTWLQYMILVAVAFVLGLLIWELVTRGDGAVAEGPGQVLQHLAASAGPPLGLSR